MSKYGIGFNGQQGFTTYPSVSVRVNADNLDLRPVTPLGVCAILAQGAGVFPPGVATSLPLGSGSPQRFITASELLTAAQFAARPFAQLGRGAGEVLIVPVNPSTPSTKAISSSTPTLLFTLTSRGWGLAFNKLQVKVETGKITLKIPGAGSGGTDLLEVFTFTSGGSGAIAGLCTDITERSAACTATFTAEGVPANAAFASFTGGTEPAAQAADWDVALHALDSRRVTAVHVATADTSVHAQLAAYAIQKRLRGFVGGAIQNWVGTSARATAIAALKSAAAALNAPRMMHVGLGGDGQPAYISAARYAALAAALDPSEPMTQKFLDFASLEASLDLATEVGGVDGVLIGGVAVPVPNPDNANTFIVSRGLSTWTGDDNLYRREQSVLAAVDAVQDLIESGLRQFLGNENTPATATRAQALVDQVLNDCTKPSSRIRIISYRRETIVAQVIQTTLRISANFTPIPPLNFIDTTLNLENANFTLTFDTPLTA